MVHSRSHKMQYVQLSLHIEDSSMFSGVGLNRRDIGAMQYLIQCDIVYAQLNLVWTQVSFHSQIGVVYEVGMVP